MNAQGTQPAGLAEPTGSEGPDSRDEPIEAVRIDVRVVRDGFTLDVAFTAAPGEVIGLLGPNGSGKSTVLDVVAGLTTPASGEVVVDGEHWDDVGTHRPPHARRVALMTAAGDLFPHLDALDNVAFGLRARGMKRHAARERASQELAAVGLSGFERRRPAALSSGQRQRVALARALSLDPRVLLLDEPLSAVDLEGRHELRALLAQRLSGSDVVTLLVTHDPLEALTLTDRLVVLEQGRIVQSGAPADAVRRPRSAFAARLVGLNLWAGHLHDDRLVTASGCEVIAAQPATTDFPSSDDVNDPAPTTPHRHPEPVLGRSGDHPPVGPRAGFAAFAPNAVSLWRERPQGSPRNTWQVSVVSLDQIGSSARVQLTGVADLVAEVTLDAVAALSLAPGTTLFATVKATDVTLYR